MVNVVYTVAGSQFSVRSRDVLMSVECPNKGVGSPFSLLCLAQLELDSS